MSAAPPAAAAGLGVRFDATEKRYGALIALRKLTLEILPGEFVALLGPNGSGKTTLLRLAAGLVRPTGGAVRHPGAPEGDALAVRAQIGMVAHSTLLYDELTARENLAFFARLYGCSDVAAWVPVLLERAGLAARAGDLVRTFSRGMRQRLAIARAMVAGPRLLLLDEPVSGLDHQSSERLAEALAEIHSGGVTVIMTAHGRSPALELATRGVWLDAGRLLRDSGPVAPGAVAAEMAAVREH